MCDVRNLTIEQKIEVIAKLNGHYSKVVWTSDQGYKLAAASKKAGCTLTRTAKWTARADINYRNTAEYAKHDHSMPSALEHVECAAKGIARNKYTGKLYLEVYPTQNGNQKMESQYYLNGVPVDKEVALALMIPSKRQSAPSAIITIPLDGLEEIG